MPLDKFYKEKFEKKLNDLKNNQEYLEAEKKLKEELEKLPPRTRNNTTWELEKKIRKFRWEIQEWEMLLEVNKEAEEAFRKNLNFSEKIKELEKDNENLSKSFLDYDKEMFQRERKIETSKKEIEKIREEKFHLEDQLDEAKEKIIIEQVEAKKALEKAKEWRERQIKELTDRKDKEKAEAIKNLEAEKNKKIRELEGEKKNLEGKKTTANDSMRDLENRVKELNKEIQQHQAESETLRREINKELPWRKEGKTLREATHNFIKEKCRHERYVPTTGDKCVRVVTAPFKWTAGKIGTGFALAGFLTAIPTICGAIGWGLKAFLAVKKGGAGGVAMVADSLINHSQNNQGGNLPPNYQPLPPAENTANLPPVINNHYHNLPAGKQANNHRKRKKKRTDNF